MAVPTLGPVVAAPGQYAAGTISWTLAQGAALAMAGFMVRKSQWGESSGDWGGTSLLGAQSESGGGGGTAARAHYLTDLTGKSGDGRSMYSQWNDWRWAWDFAVSHASASALVLADSGKWEQEGAGGATRSITLDPDGKDCVALVCAILGNTGSISSISVPDAGGHTTHVNTNPDSQGRRVAIWEADHPASLGSGSYSCYMPGTTDQILLGMLLGATPAAPAAQRTSLIL